MRTASLSAINHVRRHATPVNMLGGDEAGEGEAAPYALAELADVMQRASSVAEVRLALVRLAARVADAFRVELHDAAPLGSKSRRLACWPRAEDQAATGPTRREEAMRARPVRGAPALADGPLGLPLRSAGETVGWLLVWRSRSGTGRHESPVTVRLLTTLAAMAAAFERAEQAAVERAATPDAITGIYSPAMLSAFLTHALAQARRRHEPLSVLWIVTDRLAAIRALHGPDLADEALRQVGRAVIGRLRASDIVARLADGQLVALLPNAPAADALDIAEQVRAAIAQSCAGTADLPRLTVSIGVASYPDHGLDAETLQDAAALARAQAQAEGRNRVVVAGPLRCPAHRVEATPATRTP